MREAELRQHSTCSLCDKPIGASGLPLFWRARIERFGVSMPAIQRQTGLAMMLGSAPVAAVMGADEDLASPVMEPVTVTICETCGTERALPIAAIALGVAS